MALNIPDTAVCIDCRYMLRGLENPVCPECGQRFDPDDRRTYRDRTRRDVCFRWTHPRRNWLRYVLIIWATTTLISATNLDSFLYVLPTSLLRGPYSWLRAQFQFRVLLVMVVFCLAIGLQHCAMRILVKRIQREGSPQPVWQLMKWWWAPMCMGMVLFVLIIPWPVWLRFQFSRAPMEAAAKRQLAIGSGKLGQRTCGAYTIRAVLIYSGPNDVAFLPISGTRNAGFIYSPDPSWQRDFAYRMDKHWHFTTRWGNW